MVTISSLKLKFELLDTNKIIQDSLVETMPAFEQANKDQLRGGINNKGESILPRYKSQKYADFKQSLNEFPGNGVPDLFLTGEFYRLIDAEVGKDVIDIISKDDKGPELENKYPDIFGLGKNFKNEYLQHSLKPTVQEKITTFTGLKFQ